MLKNRIGKLAFIVASSLILVGCISNTVILKSHFRVLCDDPIGSNVLLGPNTYGWYDKQWSAALRACTDEELYDYMCKGYFSSPYVEKILNKGRCHAYIEQLKAQGLLRQDYEYNGGSSTTTTTPTYTQEEIDAAWEETGRKEPTCTEEGNISYKNKLTGKTSLETIEATGHDYQIETTVDATCSDEGKVTYKCSKCEDTYDEVIPVIEHTYVAEIKDAECEEEIVTIHTCSVCGDAYEETSPAKGHAKGEWVVSKKATIFTEGEKTLSCEKCSEILESEVLEKEDFPVGVIIGLVVALGAVAGIVVVKKKKK